MAYLNFASQLMEKKRRARLTGRQDTSRYQTTDAVGRREGASSRLATGRSIAQANENQKERNRFTAELAKQKEDFAAQQAELRAKYGAQKPPEPLGAPVYNDGGYLQSLQDWYEYKTKYPAATRLAANDPRLQGKALDPSEAPGGAQPVINPNQFDTSATFNPDDYDPSLTLEQKYALYLKSLRNPTAPARSTGSAREM